jgi:hypothetical protein
MRILILALIAVALGLSAAAPVSAAEMEHCSHAPTIAALRTCVEHAVDHGHINNPGVGQSLLAKLDSAQRSLDRSRPAVAVNQLEAFIHELDAQSGTHIVTEHATHLRTHAQHVITALGE